MSGAISLGNHEQGGTPFPYQRFGIMVPVPYEFLALGIGEVQAERFRHGASFLSSIACSLLSSFEYTLLISETS